MGKPWAKVWGRFTAFWTVEKLDGQIGSTEQIAFGDSRCTFLRGIGHMDKGSDLITKIGKKIRFFSGMELLLLNY